MRRIGPMPGKPAGAVLQTQVTGGLTVGADALDDATGKYVSAIGAALDISRDQALAIIANLRFMDLVAN